jgi:sodium/potassium-transporting ATPase subunit alpha
MLPAVALDAERPEPEAMRRPPRSLRERLIDRGLLARAYLFLGPLEAIAAMAAFFFVLGSGGWVYGQPLGPSDFLYSQGTTACLSTIIIMQVVNVFLCRSERASGFSLAVFNNRLIWAGIALALALILLIDYSPLGNRLFGTSPIGNRVWLFAIPFAVVMLALEELRKWLVRRAGSGRSKGRELISSLLKPHTVLGYVGGIFLRRRDPGLSK